MKYLLEFTENFELALILWPIASLVLTLPVLAVLYHRNGRLGFWSIVGAYSFVLYLLGLACFTLWPLPEGTTGPGITRGIPPQLNPLGFVSDVQRHGRTAVLQILFNVVFFMPLGYFVRRGFRKGLAFAAVFGFALSLLIETAQLTGLFGMYVYAYRTFDVNDLMWNTAGCVVGWLATNALSRALPAESPRALETTMSPGFVRRCVAFLLDGTLYAILSIAAYAIVLFAGNGLGLSESVQDTVGTGIDFVLLLIIEGVMPWAHAGATPGGAFVRMTCETKVRSGLRRVVFYAARLLCFSFVWALAPVAIVVFGLFYAIAHKMPYDFVPGDNGPSDNGPGGFDCGSTDPSNTTSSDNGLSSSLLAAPAPAVPAPATSALAAPNPAVAPRVPCPNKAAT